MSHKAFRIFVVATFVLVLVFMILGKAQAAPITEVGRAWAQTSTPNKVYAVAYEHRNRLQVQFHDMRVVIFKPCKFEDSRNCYWDAGRFGNGQGRSFVDLNGKARYFGNKAWNRGA